MHNKKFAVLVFVSLLSLFAFSVSYASFIETTQGTAVVNDATASYFNPAAMALLKNAQIIPLGTVARFQTTFTGSSQSSITNVAESGSSSSSSYYYSPSLFLAKPINDRFFVGFAIVSNFANRNPEENSILRYVQSSNTIQDYDFVPSIGIRINSYFSIGGGINFSYTTFDLHPIIGFPGSNVPDMESNNQSSGSGIGGNIGFLLRPTARTLIGFNYRSVTTYHESGKSVLSSPSPITSNNYHFTMHTPARSVLSISQSLTPTLGLIATLQYIQWSIVRNINIYGIANPLGNPAIINASSPQYLQDTWALTLGGNYRFTPNWIVRVAGTYNQSPSNGHYQISTGNSYILGASLGHEINKTITVDGGYAHAFIQDEKINIASSRFIINGTNQASRDVVSLKVILNV